MRHVPLTEIESPMEQSVSTDAASMVSSVPVAEVLSSETAPRCSTRPVNMLWL